MTRSGRWFLPVLLALVGCSRPDETEQLLAAIDVAGLPRIAPTESTALNVPAAAPTGPVREAINPRLLRRFEPLRSQFDSKENEISTAKVELGHMLYFEERLSKKQNVSCNSCHDVRRYGVDGEATSPGTDGVRGGRNSPTVYNAAGFFVQFWDGRAPSIEEQALGPIMNPVEMACPSQAHALQVLKSMPEYVRAFEAAFPKDPEPVRFSNVGRAIGAYERKLTTPSRWDDYLRGRQDALSAEELEGLRLFTNVGCMVCHTGEFLGGSMYQKVGVVEPWPNQKDQGRFEVTHEEGDRMMFKVPSLRNVAETAPYFHDGSASTLEDAVARMGKHQLGLKLTREEVTSIASWLKSLTGKLPEDLIQAPHLPPSSATTPAAL